jgi:hypothetical protein
MGSPKTQQEWNRDHSQALIDNFAWFLKEDRQDYPLDQSRFFFIHRVYGLAHETGWLKRHDKPWVDYEWGGVSNAAIRKAFLETSSFAHERALRVGTSFYWPPDNAAYAIGLVRDRDKWHGFRQDNDGGVTHVAFSSERMADKFTGVEGFDICAYVFNGLIDTVRASVLHKLDVLAQDDMFCNKLSGIALFV